MSSKPLAPGLLLATPKLSDGIFHKSVIALASHDQSGSMGWILNGRSLGSLVSLLRDSELTPPGVSLPDTESYQGQVQIGGPVSPRSAWVLFRGEGQSGDENNLKLSESWLVTGERAIVEAIARGEGPEEFRLLLGFARWGAGQLDSEISAGVWMPVDMNESVAFSALTGDAMWTEAYETCVGFSPYAFISRGKAQA